jgi:DNA-binding NarL/FixJ family response regulator
LPEHAEKIQIVICDDHPIFRDGLRRLLEAEKDFEIVGEASDGQQAVDLCRKLKPDVLLLDLAMPKVPGIDALRSLAASLVPVYTILLTAAIERQQMMHALELGARGVIMKDTATQLLLKGIRSVVAGQFWVGRESISDLVQYMRSNAAPASETPRKKFGLTARELEVIAELVNGGTNRDIAQKFSISEETVKRHLSNIFDKLGVSNRLELALFAMSHNLEK